MEGGLGPEGSSQGLRKLIGMLGEIPVIIDINFEKYTVYRE